MLSKASGDVVQGAEAELCCLPLAAWSEFCISDMHEQACLSVTWSLCGECWISRVIKS